MNSPAEEYTQILVKLGLTTMQAKTLLALGVHNYKDARSISRIVKVARQQIYRALPELQKMGLIEEKIDAPNQFRALPMREVLTILSDRKKTETNEILKRVSKIVVKTPNEIVHTALQEMEDYELKIITGAENLKKTFKRSYELSDKITIVANISRWTIRANYIIDFHSFKLRKGVDYRVVFGASPPAHWPSKPTDKFKVRILPFQIPMSVAVFDNKRALLTIYPKENRFEPKDFYVLSCDYPGIVKTFSIYFETLWNLAKEPAMSFWSHRQFSSQTLIATPESKIQ